MIVSAVGCSQLIARDLLADELIERLIFVERIDDVIAIFPGIGLGAIALE